MLAEAPERGEDLERILADTWRTVVPGLVHWQHPAFMGYFPTANSPASVLAEPVTGGGASRRRRGARGRCRAGRAAEDAARTRITLQCPLAGDCGPGVSPGGGRGGPCAVGVTAARCVGSSLRA
ncbi:pyridoxal-dependent decarboxylase [Kitasatospora phosalacinea]|uniref:pyridoxal-dependent decarboxylase n=1 Tax=Kitasatospora phosalacinea TaxID=2065 RepID=UPI003652ABC7